MDLGLVFTKLFSFHVFICLGSINDKNLCDNINKSESFQCIASDMNSYIVEIDWSVHNSLSRNDMVKVAIVMCWYEDIDMYTLQ